MCMPIVPYWLQWLSLAFLGTSPLPIPWCLPSSLVFCPLGWSPLQRRHADPVSQQGLAEREKAFGGAHPLFAKWQLHVPAAVLQPLPCLPGREESGTSQVPVRYTSVSWDKSRIFQYSNNWDFPSYSVGGRKLPLVSSEVLVSRPVEWLCKDPPQLTESRQLKISPFLWTFWQRDGEQLAWLNADCLPAWFPEGYSLYSLGSIRLTWASYGPRAKIPAEKYLLMSVFLQQYLF